MKFYSFAIGIIKGLLKVFLLFRAKGKKNIPQEGAFLLCANHNSLMDPVLIAAGCKRQLTFMGKDELFHVPVLGRLIKALGAFPIKRGKGDAAAVMATLKIMKRGGATLIFPEGKRMPRGERKSVNSGIIRLAMQSEVPILPAYVSRNKVVFGEPVYYNEHIDDMKDQEKMQILADSLMDTIYALNPKQKKRENKK